jgi:Rrf2 family protein
MGLGLPKPYLARIVNQLMHEGLVTTKRGYRGGVVLAHRPEEISLLEVVRAVEGNGPMSRCVFGLEKCCVHKKCPAHVPWNRMRKQIEAMLSQTMLSAVMKATALALASDSVPHRPAAVRRG